MTGITQTAPSLSYPERWWQLSEDLLCVVDGQGQFSMLNDAWERVLGWSPSELEGTQVAMLLHPDDLPRMLAVQTAARSLGRFESVEGRCRTADGSYRRLLCSGFRGDGAWYVSGKDLTES